MAKAQEGTGDKRAPITVQADTDGKLNIVDGNSTYAVAQANGWESIPVEVIPPDGDFGKDFVNDPHLDTWEELEHVGKRVMDKSPDSYQAVLDMGKGLSAEIKGARVATFDDSLGEYEGPMVVFGPLKSIERATEKVVNKYGGEWNRLSDVVRASVVAPPSQLKSITTQLATEAEERGWTVVGTESKIDRPTPVGYRDFSFDIRSPAGLIAELQVVSPAMWRAKNTQGHKYYEEWRSFSEKGIKNERTQELVELQRQLYTQAWEEDSKL